MGRKVIKTANAPQAIGPYSQAIEAMGFVFISGQIPIDHATGNVVNADIGAQTKLILENAKSILRAADCGMENVVKATIYLKDMDDFGSVNEVYSRYFPKDPPTRSTVEVSRLPRDVSVEMDFIACKEPVQQKF